jgi:hypothetical protein
MVSDAQALLWDAVPQAEGVYAHAEAGLAYEARSAVIAQQITATLRISDMFPPCGY